ncbi:amino acid/amide ABC transporter ATP-binding protein 1 (HAAT family) [Actinocorallia herbida]|uniref:Amino acid/amide ABC transporter ATP-binding protein 1 (HAAT family) n=1 Tax=Actinocorallia herbida TaxID=58109 RepID=A0A3N1CQC5_9ACTN|nr:ABC transporter ATP-binding protein [Actinocorallia herbida]ROO83483.1 amino acid/amide ABC transporter ATP-binding protein 1 (HAAT family) [Actinocorallia herbida]
MSLELEGISVSFGGVHALSEVSFTVAEGQVCGVIGPNGAGKTTLFDVVTGLRRPDGGQVRVDGADVTGRGAVRRARDGMARTFQRPQVFGRLTVLENVLTALEWHGGGGGLAADLLALPTRRSRERARRARAEEALARCGIADLAGLYAAELPIGRRRLVELARALADDPKILLLDEPTSGLDPAQAEVFAGVLASVEATVLLVEHDVGFVMDTCERIVVLDLGKVIAEGAPAEVRDDPAVRAAYLG